MEASPLRVVQVGPVARVWLARPAVRNAFDDETARALAEAFDGLTQEWALRAVVLEGEGGTFCAGGDLGWMRRAAAYDAARNLADAAAFQRAFEAIDRFPRPVVAVVRGAALGGGAGLAAACDLVLAAGDAVLGFPEVRLGLVPGVVAPYVLRRVGPAVARRLFLTGERVGAEEARRLGLVDEVAPPADLDAALTRWLDRLAEGSPEAQGRAKALVRDLTEAPSHPARLEVARRAIADARASADGREGIEAFLARRRPRWAP